MSATVNDSPAGEPVTPTVRKVAIIGGGVIGGGWAARFALNGWHVNVYDPAADAARLVDEVLANARRVLPMLYERVLPEEGPVQLCDTLESALEGVEWVQESVPERLELKHAVRDAIEAVVASDLPIASSTSGFRPSELAEGAAHPDRILVAHPFNPVYLLPLIELVGGDSATDDRATTILSSIGLYPLRLRRENDAHIADRLLEAVWRESLWLIRDGYASTQEIDDAIRYGFGLRWAQMGLFETYRIAGGEGGMAHFVEQFGPCLQWPWTKLTDVPELTTELVDAVASQSDAQSGQHSIRQLEQLRDDNLVAILRALKGQGAAAGTLISEHEKTFPQRVSHSSEHKPGTGDDSLGAATAEHSMLTVHRSIPVDWTDYNGHMNESRYGQVFSDAADAVLVHVGCDAAYVASGLSWFTAENNIRYLNETRAAETVLVQTRVVLAQGKKLKLHHDMRRVTDNASLATCEQFLLHVSLETRRSCDPDTSIVEKLARLVLAHQETAP